VNPRPRSTPRSTPFTQTVGHELFLLAGWLLVATPTLALWAGALRRAEGWPPLPLAWPFLLLAAAWLACRLPPFRSWSAGRAAGAVALLALATALAGGVQAALHHADPTDRGLDVGRAALPPLLVSAGAGLAAILLRRRPTPVRGPSPDRRQALPVWIFLTLSAGLLRPFDNGAPGWEPPLPGLLVLALAAAWWQAAEFRPAWLRERNMAGGGLTVALASLSWLLDLAWLVDRRRLPAGVLLPETWAPGLLILAAGTALLVWASLRPRPQLPGGADPLPSRLPQWLAAAALLLALAARRPGLALGAGVLAAWFALPRPTPPTPRGDPRKPP
jgi:hypothetical protein